MAHNVRIEAQIPQNPKPGVEDLIHHVVHCVNAALILDDSIESLVEQEHGDVAKVFDKFAGQIEHLTLLNDTTGPLLAECEQPLETLCGCFVSINKSVVHQFVQQITLATLAGHMAGDIQARQDHVIAMITQIFYDILSGHLDAIQYTNHE